MATQSPIRNGPPRRQHTERSINQHCSRDLGIHSESENHEPALAFKASFVAPARTNFLSTSLS